MGTRPQCPPRLARHWPSNTENAATKGMKLQYQTYKNVENSGEPLFSLTVAS